MPMNVLQFVTPPRAVPRIALAGRTRACARRPRAPSSLTGDPAAAAAPMVHFRGRSIPARAGATLRDTLLRADAVALSPHNGGAALINCRGLGTCGTCAVAVIRGEVCPERRSARERARLSFPPHNLRRAEMRNLRLACQTRVVGDVWLRKNDRFWGQGENEQPYGGGAGGEV